MSKKKQKKVGRPTIMTEKTVERLRNAFAIGCTDIEACLHAEITEKTLYNYQNKHPEFLQEKERLKQKPLLKARRTVVDALDQVSNAQWYLERKSKDEFSTKTITENDESSEALKMMKDFVESNKPKEDEQTTPSVSAERQTA